MAKAFKNRTLRAWACGVGAAQYELWMAGKQKLVEIPRIEEIAFHCSTHCTLLMTKYLDT